METKTWERLLAAAKTGDSNAVDQLLTGISDSLHSAATHRLGSSIQSRVDASNVVQQSLFEVSQSLSDFRGRTAAEWHSWTRRILHHNVSNEVDRHFHAQKRTVARSQSFDEEGTATGLFEYVLRQRQSSPGQQAQDNESRQSLEMAITDLPDAQQTAIRMRYIEDMPIAKIGLAMSRTNTAVAGLLKRGLKQLRTRVVSITESI